VTEDASRHRCVSKWTTAGRPRLPRADRERLLSKAATAALSSSTRDATRSASLRRGATTTLIIRSPRSRTSGRRHRVGSARSPQRLITHPPDSPRVGAAMKELWSRSIDRRAWTRCRPGGDRRAPQGLREDRTCRTSCSRVPRAPQATSAIALARDMFGEDWRRILELNSSDERGIETYGRRSRRCAPRAFGGRISRSSSSTGRQPDGGRQAAARRWRRTRRRPASSCRKLLVAAHRADQSRTAVFRFAAQAEAIASTSDGSRGGEPRSPTTDGSPRLRRGRGHATRGERVQVAAPSARR